MVEMQWGHNGDTVGTEWGHSGDTAVANKEWLTLDYEKLGTTVGVVDEEWKSFKDALVGVAEELCGRTSGKGGSSSRRKHQT